MAMTHVPVIHSSYPIVLTKLSEAKCLVIGGGKVAERKVRGLLEAGANLQVISPTLTANLQRWRDEGKLEHLPRPYQSGDVSGASLVIAATDNVDVNGAIAKEGARLGSLVNVVDRPAKGNFHTVATVRRDDVLVTISTNGKSPALAAQLRRELETQIGGYAKYLELF